MPVVIIVSASQNNRTGVRRRDVTRVLPVARTLSLTIVTVIIERV